MKISWGKKKSKRKGLGQHWKKESSSSHGHSFHFWPLHLQEYEHLIQSANFGSPEASHYIKHKRPSAATLFNWMVFLI